MDEIKMDSADPAAPGRFEQLPGALEWFMQKSQQDASALAMYNRLVNQADIPRGLAPKSADSAHACLELLDDVPGLRDHLTDMQDCGSDWEAVMGQWHLIERAVRNEAGTHMPATQQLLDAAHGARQMEDRLDAAETAGRRERPSRRKRFGLF